MFWRKDGVKLCGFSSQCRCGLVNLGVVRCSCGIVWGIYLRTQRAKAWFWIQHIWEVIFCGLGFVKWCVREQVEPGRGSLGLKIPPHYRWGRAWSRIPWEMHCNSAPKRQSSNRTSAVPAITHLLEEYMRHVTGCSHYGRTTVITDYFHIPLSPN